MPELSNLTPKLTAEVIAERKRLAGLCEHGRDAETRRKAIEWAIRALAKEQPK